MQKSSFNLEKKLRKQGYRIIIGVDEAGRGPLAGPVIACAVVLKYCHPERSEGSQVDFSRFFADAQNDKGWDLIKDSKKLSAKQREIAFDFIQENFYVGVGMCDHKIIDRINILQASLLAMKKAITSLIRGISKYQFPTLPTGRQVSNKIPNPNDKKFKNARYQMADTKYIILVDGNKKILNLNYEQQAIVGGDRKIKSIAAASIIAKVTRDRLMQKMDKKYPQYGFAKHKGYGTKIHLQNLEKHGHSSIHRLSFRPIKKA